MSSVRIDPEVLVITEDNFERATSCGWTWACNVQWFAGRLHGGPYVSSSLRTIAALQGLHGLANVAAGDAMGDSGPESRPNEIGLYVWTRRLT